MNKCERYIANFTMNGEDLMKIYDSDKEKLLVRAVELLESAFNDATCTIKEAESQTIIQTLKRNSIE